MAEWLWRGIRVPMGLSRISSNLVRVAFLFFEIPHLNAFYIAKIPGSAVDNRQSVAQNKMVVQVVFLGTENMEFAPGNDMCYKEPCLILTEM